MAILCRNTPIPIALDEELIGIEVVLGVKGYYSYRVVLFQGLGAYPWGGKFEDKLSIVRWH